MAEYKFDYIVIGAGSAGCVVANRLSAQNGASVLLLEGGGPDNRPEIHNGDLPSLLALWNSPWSAELDWGYQTEPEPYLNNRRIPIARGKVLGGCSSNNAFMYVRGNRRDFDHWSYLGNEGWGYDEVLPYFKKSEDYDGGPSQYHGLGGLLSVVDHKNPTPVARAFVDGVVELGYGGPGWDFNGAQQEGGAGFYQVTKTRDGKRSSTAVAFLSPIAGRTNLSIKTNAQATRLVREGTRIRGVEYVQDRQSQRAVADREVILCAGVFESPKLLMLSGIGPAAHLRAHDIPVAVDLPGVGQNLQDHLFLGIAYACKREHPPQTLVSEAGFFTRTRGDQASAPNLQFTFGGQQFIPPEYRRPGPGFTFGPVVIRPQSAGVVELRSSNPTDRAVVRAHYLECDSDLEVFLAALRLAREIARTRAFDDFRGAELAPGDSVRDEQRLAEFVRQTCSTLWHPTGTCKMGRDRGAVVDPQLRVVGVQGLRVADASIMPTIVSGNTNAACIMIGEKAADLILLSP